MAVKAENPDTMLVEYTNRLIIQHLLLVEDHLLEYHREPNEQCLSCLYWHCEKLIAYTSLECVKFEGTNTEACSALSSWASSLQVKLEGLTQNEALEYSRQARQFRYKIAGEEDKETGHHHHNPHSNPVVKCVLEEDYYHCRIKDPEYFDPREEVGITIGCRKGQWDEKIGRCTEGLTKT